MFGRYLEDICFQYMTDVRGGSSSSGSYWPPRIDCIMRASKDSGVDDEVVSHQFLAYFRTLVVRVVPPTTAAVSMYVSTRFLKKFFL